jgi:hypothetical protein
MSAGLTALTYLRFHASGSSFSPWLAELSEEYASSCDGTRLFFPPGGVDSFNSALVDDLFRSALTSFFWRLYSSSSTLWGNSSLARLKNSTGFSASVTFVTADLLKSERFFGTGGTSILEPWSAIVGLGCFAKFRGLLQQSCKREAEVGRDFVAKCATVRDRDMP